MPKYSHLYDLTVQVDSQTSNASDVTAEMLWSAFQTRIAGLTERDIEGDLIRDPNASEEVLS